ncbi:MAG: hypothetical protein QW303_02735 [Nitrososphaerota archaeon]
MVTYEQLARYLKNYYKHFTTIKKNYFIIMFPNLNYHITVFRDQWDDYQKITGMPYHLFHISSNRENNRCSSYFWVDKYDLRIKKIPRKYFKYSQPEYSFYGSTRNACRSLSIKHILRVFQKILKVVNERNYSQHVTILSPKTYPEQ